MLQPINADGTSVFKAGATVPVRFQLTDDFAGMTDLVARFSYTMISNGVAGPVNEGASTSAATTGNAFRDDWNDGVYIFNWGTKGLSAGTYQLRIDLGDGLIHSVIIGLR